MLQGFGLTLLAAVFAAALPVSAQQTQISEARGAFSVSVNGARINITRNGPTCPPACVQPIVAARGIATIGELEMLDFLEAFVGEGQGLLIDARLPEGYQQATLPGAVSVPAATLRPDNPYRDDLLNALRVRDGDFSGAFDLVFFGDSAADAAPVEALTSLIEAGYPSTKLKYYRGGLLTWQGLGLSTVAGQ